MSFYRRSWVSAVEFVGAGAALFRPRSRRRYWPACFLLALSSLFAASPLNAASDMYALAELEADAVRLRNAIIRIYEIGLKPSMTAAEKQAVGAFEFTFPLPKPDDVLLNFAATTDGRRLIMPLASLKTMEDLATAYAWRYVRRQPLRAIDLYFAMLRPSRRQGVPRRQASRDPDRAGCAQGRQCDR